MGDRLPHRRSSDTVSPQHRNKEIMDGDSDGNSRSNYVIKRKIQSAEHQTKPKSANRDRSTDMKYSRYTKQDSGVDGDNREEPFYRQNRTNIAPECQPMNETFNIKVENENKQFVQMIQGDRRYRGDIEKIKEGNVRGVYRGPSNTDLFQECGSKHTHEEISGRSYRVKEPTLSDDDFSSGELPCLDDDTMRYDSVDSSRTRGRVIDSSMDLVDSGTDMSGGSGYTHSHRPTASTSTLLYDDSQSSDDMVELLSPQVANTAQQNSYPSNSQQCSSANKSNKEGKSGESRHVDQLLCSPKYHNFQKKDIKQKIGVSPASHRERQTYRTASKHHNDGESLMGGERDRKRNVKRKLEVPHGQDVENAYIVQKMSHGKKHKASINDLTYGMRKSHPCQTDDLMVVKNRHRNRKMTIKPECTQQSDLVNRRHVSKQMLGQTKYN